MDDESGESIKPMEEVPLIGLQGESKLERLVRVDGEKPEVDSRAEGKQRPTRRNDLLFAEN